MRRIIRIIDAISDSFGKFVMWFSVALVAIVAYEVVMRYVFTKPSLWEYESASMIGATLYALAFTYVLRHKINVRVDIIYNYLSARGKAIVDSVGALVAFFPLLGLVAYSSISKAVDAWVNDEKMAITGWYPPAAPIRTVLAIGFTMLLIQGIAQFVKDVYVVLRNRAYD